MKFIDTRNSPPLLQFSLGSAGDNISYCRLKEEKKYRREKNYGPVDTLINNHRFGLNSRRVVSFCMSLQLLFTSGELMVNHHQGTKQNKKLYASSVFRKAANLLPRAIKKNGGKIRKFIAWGHLLDRKYENRV